MDEFDFRVATDRMDMPVPSFTGDKLQAFPAGYGVDAYICFRNLKPLPCTVVGIFPILQTADAR